MSAWLVPLLCRAGALAGRLAAPTVIAGSLLPLGIAAARSGLDGAIDAPLALFCVAVVALGLTGCVIWAVAVISDHRRTDNTQPPL
jgi:hypothetical protein